MAVEKTKAAEKIPKVKQSAGKTTNYTVKLLVKHKKRYDIISLKILFQLCPASDDTLYLK